MNPIYQDLYDEMQRDMARCLDLPHPEKENVESCYWIARHYWEQLQEILKGKEFGNQRQEIAFFREVKPAFVRYIEYFSLLAEGLQFEPGEYPLPGELSGKMMENQWGQLIRDSRCAFWKGEIERGERYYKKHQAFLSYCESHCHQDDKRYFLPENCSRGDLTQRRPHNRDTELYTVQEEILTSWRAFQLYGEYIKRKVHEAVSK